MFAIQQYCEQLAKYTPLDERDENTGWLTLNKFEDYDECKHVFDRGYHDGIERKQRIEVV